MRGAFKPTLLLSPLLVLASPYSTADPVALQSADIACSTLSGRYVDCGNGTVTDNATGLTWTKDATCLGIHNWYNASVEAQTLADGHCGLTDGSSPGEWRLPTLAEWETMVKDAVAIGNCDPTITNDAGNGCWTNGGDSSFTDIVGFEFGVYWTATTSSSTTADAHQMFLINGSTSTSTKNAAAYVWAVRGGQ